MIIIIIQKRGFYERSIHYGDTGSMYIQKKYWAKLVNIGFVGKDLGLGKNEYSDSDTFFAWFLIPKIKYCSVIDDFVVISAKRTFKGFNEGHRMIRFKKFIPLLEEKTVYGCFSINWTESFGGIKILHQKHRCFESKNEKFGSNSVQNLNRIVIIFMMERACKSCWDLIS